MSAQQLLVQAAFEPHRQQLVALPTVLLTAHADDLIGTQVIQASLPCSLARVPGLSLLGKRQRKIQEGKRKLRDNQGRDRKQQVHLGVCHVLDVYIAYPSPSTLSDGLHIENAQLIPSIVSKIG